MRINCNCAMIKHGSHDNSSTVSLLSAVHRELWPFSGIADLWQLHLVTAAHPSRYASRLHVDLVQ
jgi:hypothetical protein